jgi:hypothetical protein
VQTGRPECLVGVLVRDAEGVTNPGVQSTVLPLDECESVLAAGVARQRADLRQMPIGGQVHEHVHIAILKSPETHVPECRSG